MRYKPLVWLMAPVCLAVVFCLVPLLYHCSAGEPAAKELDVDALIAQLGSDEFEVREMATRRLKAREDALPALRRACRSRDAEVAQRAGKILDSFAGKQNKRDFAEFDGLLKSGTIDQAVETFVRREPWTDEKAAWKVLADLAGQLTELERKSYGKASLPANYARLNEDQFPVIVREGRLTVVPARGSSPKWWERRIVLRAEQITKGNERIVYSLFALSGSIKAQQHVVLSVILAGGSVEVDDVVKSLIVCDGDFTADSITDSLIIARGTIRCAQAVRNSRLITCGVAKLSRPDLVSDSKVVEKEPKPLSFIKFFDPADVGIKVESAKGGVRVKEAEKGKRFAAACIQADDVITAIEGESATDAEAFRRLLRMNLAIGGEMIFKVRRGEKTLDIRVPEKS